MFIACAWAATVGAQDAAHDDPPSPVPRLGLGVQGGAFLVLPLIEVATQLGPSIGGRLLVGVSPAVAIEGGVEIFALPLESADETHHVLQIQVVNRPRSRRRGPRFLAAGITLLPDVGRVAGHVGAGGERPLAGGLAARGDVQAIVGLVPPVFVIPRATVGVSWTVPPAGER